MITKISKTVYIDTLKGEDLPDVDIEQYSDCYLMLSDSYPRVLAVCGIHKQKNNITQVNGLVSFSKGAGKKLLELLDYPIIRLNCTPALYNKVYSKVGFKAYLALPNYIECMKHNKKALKVNDVLITKDGSKIGNSIVIRVDHSNIIPQITVKTDYGNVLLLSGKHVKELFHDDIKQASDTHKHYVSNSIKFKVRLEFNVKSSEFLNVEVLAKNKTDATRKAIEKYTENPNESDMYAGEYIDTYLETENSKEWQVTEIVEG